MDETLAGLMARYCAGDVAALRSLYAQVAPRLLSYLIGLLGERAGAEDVLQRAFLKLHQARAMYIEGADPVPWIYAIAHRTALDELRRRRRSRIRLADRDAPELAPRAEITGHLEGSREPPPDPQRLEVTLAALQRLPAAQREALVLTKLEGRSIAEAAAICGTTPGAMKVRSHRACAAVRRLVGDGREP